RSLHGSDLRAEVPAERRDLGNAAAAGHAELHCNGARIVDEFATMLTYRVRISIHFVRRNVDADVVYACVRSRKTCRLAPIVVELNDRQIECAVREMHRPMVAPPVACETFEAECLVIEARRLFGVLDLDRHVRDTWPAFGRTSFLQ